MHESLNEGDEHRDMLKLHLISRRLEGKFSKHPDWLAPIGKSKNDEHVNSVKNLTRIAQGKRL